MKIYMYLYIALSINISLMNMAKYELFKTFLHKQKLQCLDCFMQSIGMIHLNFQMPSNW